MSYEADPISRKIINYCLEVCHDLEYVIMILAAAARSNVSSLIYNRLEIYDISLIEDDDDWPDVHKQSFTKAEIIILQSI